MIPSHDNLVTLIFHWRNLCSFLILFSNCHSYVVFCFFNGQDEAAAAVDTFWTKAFESDYREKLQNEIKVGFCAR